MRAQLRVTEAKANAEKQQASTLIDGLRSQLEAVTETQVSRRLASTVSAIDFLQCLIVAAPAHLAFAEWRQTANNGLVFHSRQVSCSDTMS